MVIVKKRIAIVLSVCLIMAVPAMALEQRSLPLGDLQVSADTLGSVVLGQNIKLMMRDGTYMEGKVIRTSREEIIMQVKKCEPKGRVQGAEVGLQTSDIATVCMKKNGSVVAPVALGVLGGILGLYAGAYAAYRSCDEGVLLLGMLGGATAGASAGAYAGHEAAKKTITVSVVPAGR
jgi:hypothetical protein